MADTSWDARDSGDAEARNSPSRGKERSRRREGNSASPKRRSRGRSARDSGESKRAF